MSRLRDRLGKIEEAMMILPDDHGPQLITIHGGLPDGPLHATAGGLNIMAEPGETLQAFKLRALGIAAEIGAEHVVVGGLPPRE